MSAFLDGESPVFDIDDIADQLLEQGLSTPPSQLHGCLCGLLAAGMPPQQEAGLAGLNQALDLDLHGELAGQMMQLYSITALALEDDEFDFAPMLPDDSCELTVRTAALAAWCHGFLAGYARAVALAGRQQDPVSADSGEILRDLAIIAQAAVDETAEEEESENSYAELVEYIRVAALNAFMDSGFATTTSNPAPAGGPRLH
jgi:uncharacterized protein YgfB (UPF0149 family)